MVGKSNVQEIAILAIIREISDSNLETGGYDPKSGVSPIIREWTALWLVINNKKINASFTKWSSTNANYVVLKREDRW